MDKLTDATTFRYLSTLNERLQSLLKTFTTKQLELYEFETNLLKPFARDFVRITSNNHANASSGFVPNLPLVGQIFRLQTRNNFIEIVNFTVEKLIAGGTTEELNHLMDAISLTPFYSSVHPNVLVFGRLSYLTLYLKSKDPLACPLKLCKFRIQLLIRVLFEGREIAVPLATDEWRRLPRTITGSVNMQLDLRRWKKVPTIRDVNKLSLPRLKHKADDFILQIHCQLPDEQMFVLASLPRCRVIGSETKTPQSFLNPDVVMTELMLQIAEEVSVGVVEDKKRIAMTFWKLDGFKIEGEKVTKKKETKVQDWSE
jgi:hypothetical protein